MTSTRRPGEPFTAVIFDMDGVVADTEQFWHSGWAACAEHFGQPWSTERSVALQGMSTPEWSSTVATAVGAPDPDWVRDFVIGHILAELDRAELMPHARELIEHAADRVPIALATSSARPLIDKVLAVHGLTEKFSANVSSAEVARGKPSPDVYLEAARRLGVGDGPILAIEDSGNGMRAVHAAGFFLLAIPNEQFPPPAEAIALADVVAADHADALSLLRELLP